ncbi:cytochrome c peroxidase [Sulfuritortus calidifontis]|uniref:Cytochrome c peroxidase n=1 Tax=Sulfuritortus calidifontis TaxID=1914471 RepID=A0A4R3JTP4_9PROT|nr:cytochrome-c peroxidase [Sulfuritortus calidifontis]TCS70887.1 cytochrome c peroxidase [Sulfuritortus calidifontis]
MLSRNLKVVRWLAVLVTVLVPPAGAEPVSANRQAVMEQLGQAIFFDANLSEPAGQACATCHDPNAAFTDPNRALPVSRGVRPGRLGSRNAPTALYAAFSPKFHFDKEEGLYVGGQFLDGRAADLEQQAEGPFLNPLEMANPDKKTVVRKLRRAAYAPLFEQVFGQGALNQVDRAYRHMVEAIAAFERTPRFAPFSSKYDAYLAGQASLTEQELRGLKLFEDEKKGNCAACHPSRPGPQGEPPLFTDFTYDNLGVPKNPDNPFYRLPKSLNPAGRHFVDRGLGATVKKRSEDGKFKVPTLRNIALTAPYMHNGYFNTLRGVTLFYNDRDTRPRCKQALPEAEALRQNCWPAPEVAANVNREELGDLKLTDQEVDDIVAFMRTLTDGWRPE